MKNTHPENNDRPQNGKISEKLQLQKIILKKDEHFLCPFVQESPYCLIFFPSSQKIIIRPSDGPT